MRGDGRQRCCGLREVWVGGCGRVEVREGQTLGPPCQACCCVVMMGAIGACVVAACGLEAGGACSPAVVVAVVVAGGIWDVVAMVVPTGSVIMTCCSDTPCVALGGRVSSVAG